MCKKKIPDPEGSMEELIARAVDTAKATFTTDRNPEFYRFLFSPEDRLFAVQTCGISDKGANRVRLDARSDNCSVKTMDLVRFVYQSCRWKENISYRVPGVVYPADRAVQFDLAAAYEIHEGRVQAAE